MKLPILDITQFHDTGDIESFYANDFESHLRNNRDIISHPHKHNFYLSVLFIEGEGIHEIDFESYSIKPGSIFLLRPGQTHSWKFTKPGKGYIFFHSKEFYEAICQNKNLNIFPFFFSNQNSPSIYLNKETMSSIEPLFISILNETRSSAPLKKQKLVNLIDLIYIELSRLVLKDSLEDLVNSKNFTMKLYKFEQLIEEKYKTLKSALAYAEIMNISVKHLNRICKETIGKTTTDLILERVILEAKRQILYSENNLAEIAWDLGYDDYSHFSKLFKQKSGISPSQFQKMYLKKV
ncbi:AraC family transcriptional regulator [Aquimarina algiphila]|uniref:Helix-turn-helix domain-containing protein n=1 Tax=Aquimarina algiphila TaxID=2047982 RepID=A0A554VJ30_9FLAO|nr:helix-turn-helix domain-containing protein [Aquimarina algiphila]TSE07837.1 helix-turn-helix domain-containing protein [Aquimarina algiphila]